MESNTDVKSKRIYVYHHFLNGINHEKRKKRNKVKNGMKGRRRKKFLVPCEMRNDKMNGMEKIISLAMHITNSISIKNKNFECIYSHFI